MRVEEAGLKPASLLYDLPSGQLAVLDAVGLVGGGAKSAFAVFFIFGIIAVKPDGLAFAFKRQNVRANSI